MYHRVRYDRRSSGQILRGGISPLSLSLFLFLSNTAFPMFCLGGGSLDRVSNRGPISGDPSNGPRSDLKRGGGEIRQIALSGLATSKWIKLRSAIDSSHASFDRSTRAISLFRACLTAEPCPRLFLSVLRHGSKSIRLFIELKVAVYIVKISTKNRRRRYNHEKCDVVEVSAEAFSRQDFQRC